MATTTERAILAGGCFWGMQQLVRRLPGVVSTRVGYSGGNVKNATYSNHGTHAEAIEITFDPNQTSFRDLLEFFFSRSTTRRRPTSREMTGAQATGRRFSTRARNNAASPRTPSPTSRPQGCGRARS
jgi:methionine-S-sulfoxide reductase